MKTKFLPAFNGDCIIISFKDKDGQNRNILIDGGTPRTYPRILKKEYENVDGNIDLLIVTHIDDDHIGGIKKLFEDTKSDKSKIKKVIFNSGGLLNHYFGEDEDARRMVSIVPDDTVEVSPRQGNVLEAKLDELGCIWVKKIIKQGDKLDFYGAEINILSPNEKGLNNLNQKWETESDIQVLMSGSNHDDFSIDIKDIVEKSFKQDSGIPNGSSIAFLINYSGISGLLLGDAFPSVIVEGLQNLGYTSDNKVKLDFYKVSHHASKGNTSPELLDLIDCENFIVSTNGLKHGLPDKEAIARIISKFPSCKIFFTYGEYLDRIETEKDKESKEYQLIDLSQQNYELIF